MEFTGPNLAGIPRQANPLSERRHSVRHRVHSPAYASLDVPSDATTQDLSEVLDISERGMSIQTASPLEVDRNLDLCLDLSETAMRIRTTGQVVWANPSGRAGIRFAPLSGQALGQLKEWLFVNVLTAFDHARLTSPEADASDDASNRRIQGPDVLQRNAFASLAQRVSGEGRSPVREESLQREHRQQRELQPNGYDRETTLQSIAERALTSTRATGAAIALTEGDEMICVASAGSDAPPVGTRLQVGSGFSGECVRTGRALRCDDSERDERVDREGCRVLGIRSMVAVPIKPGNRVTGLVEVFSSQPYAFNATDISFLQQLSGVIVSTMGQGAPAPAPAPDIQKAPVPRSRPARIASPPAIELAAKTATAVKPAKQPRLHKILLVSAIATFVFAVLWLISPWVLGTIRSSGRTLPQVQPAQASTARPGGLPAEVNDLASLRKVAERGDPAAQFALGARYATGEEVKQDYTEAVRWFTQAAEQGHILAQATLGAYYWAGRGVSQDLTKAYFWSVLARAGGDQASKYRVAVLTSRMTRGQVLAAQQQANDWLRNHQLTGEIPPSE